MKYFQIILSIFSFLWMSQYGYAQNTQVTGTVVDDYGPVIGASVMVQGTSTGTVTDMDGRFTLKDVKNADKAVLIVRYVGMKEAKEQLKGRRTNIVIQMIEDSNHLDDVVVIGYGTQKRGNLTGAISTVSGAELEKVPTTSVAEAIVGRLPGVQVTAADGSPDADITILIRGGGSITQDNTPLILVDGFEVSSLKDIPPTDVESIDVLKDAASTAIYGARGANGVILVTTKKPNEGRISINLNAYLQTKTLSNKLDVMDPYEYVMMQYENSRNKSLGNQNGVLGNRFGQTYEFYIYQGDEGTDWQDEIFGTNPTSQYYDLNVNGGTEKMKYKVSFIHQDQPGVMECNGLRQNNFNVTLNSQLNKHLTLEYRMRLLNKTVYGAGTEGVSLLTALRQAPTEGLDDYMEVPEDNEYFDADVLEEKVRWNPREEAEQNYKRRINKSLNTAGALTWQIIKGLTYRVEFGYEDNSTENKRYWGIETSTAKGANNKPVVEWSMTQGSRWQLSNVLNYNFLLKDKHDFRIMLGQEIKNNESRTKSYTTREFPETTTADKAFDNLSLGTAYTNSASAGSPTRVSSFFGRVNYAYEGKYIGMVTLRADGSSRFAKGNRWGFFPSFSAAWRISNEEFMKDFKSLSNLKLRLSYGASGNDRISDDLYRKLYGISSTRSAGWNETDRYYYKFYNTSYLYNPDLKWETTISRNLGVDFGFFNERINGSIEVYWNTVKDLLVPSDIPGYTGYTKIMSNVGQTSNKGIELQLTGYIIDRPDFRLSATFNIGHNKNKIDKLASGESEWILSSGWAGTNLLNTDDYRAYVGGTTGLIYGYVNDGFYTVDDFEYFDSDSRTWHLKEGVVDSSPLSGTLMPGHAKFKKLTPVDETSANPYQLTESDRTVIGRTTPKCSGGFGLNAYYKGFDMSVFFNYMVGFDVFNANKVITTSFYNNSFNNFTTEVSLEKRFRYYDNMGNLLTYSPEALAEFNKNATIWSPLSFSRPVCMSWAVEDGSFLRLNTLSIGYTIPRKITQKWGMNKLRFYLTGYNLFTLTGYSGYDPEVNIGTGLTPNIDYNKYPRSTTYTLGVNVSF